MHIFTICSVVVTGFLSVVFGEESGCCLKLSPINRGLKDDYCDQPLFVNFLPKTEENQLVDNICLTFFPLPDDPDTYQMYYSRVFCDGSNDIITSISTNIEQGVIRAADAFCTNVNTYFGYAGCDTYIGYHCTEYGVCGDSSPYVYGLSPNCRPMGLSCLRKVEEILKNNCLPEIDYYMLPMKLPNRCVTQKLCVNPHQGNKFYKSIGLSGPLHRR